MNTDNDDTIEIICPICSEKIYMNLSSDFCICDVCNTRIELDQARLEKLRESKREDSDNSFSKNTNVNFSI